ncbi:hypothetical protein K439DRAFT_1373466, partial [Ramaria rubella]
MAAKKRKEDQAAGIPSTLSWSANKNEKIWALIAELSKPENFKVMFGKKDKTENMSGESKNTVFTCIGEHLWPKYTVINKKTVTQHTKHKYDGLKDTYREHAKKLLQTGGGIQVETEVEGEGEEWLQFYIAADGPDANTSLEVLNLWDQIVQEFEFFLALHAI